MAGLAVWCPCPAPPVQSLLARLRRGGSHSACCLKTSCRDTALTLRPAPKARLPASSGVHRPTWARAPRVSDRAELRAPWLFLLDPALQWTCSSPASSSRLLPPPPPPAAGPRGAEGATRAPLPSPQVTCCNSLIPTPTL